MERVRWTDERIDERMAAMDEKFDRQFDELRLLRQDMHGGFAELRTEMRAGFAELRTEIVALHRQTTYVVAAFAVGLLGLLGVRVV